jgi:hypothetical protein
VLRAIPVARLTALTPPGPAVIASAAAKRRRPGQLSGARLCVGLQLKPKFECYDVHATVLRCDLIVVMILPPQTNHDRSI